MASARRLRFSIFRASLSLVTRVAGIFPDQRKLKIFISRIAPNPLSGFVLYLSGLATGGAMNLLTSASLMHPVDWWSWIFLLASSVCLFQTATRILDATSKVERDGDGYHWSSHFRPKDIRVAALG